MCGRYCAAFDNLTAEELMEAINEANRKITNYAAENKMTDKAKQVITSGTVFPGNFTPVLTDKGFTVMRWGYKGWDKSGLIFNARSDKIIESKSIFAKPARETRCLVPAKYYLEWMKKNDAKIRHKFWQEDVAVFWMAGVYSTADDSPLPAFSVITSDASESIRTIHDRMPVILREDEQRNWLSPHPRIEAVLGAGVKDICAIPDEPVQMALF